MHRCRHVDLAVAVSDSRDQIVSSERILDRFERSLIDRIGIYVHDDRVGEQSCNGMLQAKLAVRAAEIDHARPASAFLEQPDKSAGEASMGNIEHGRGLHGTLRTSRRRLSGMA